MRYTWYTSDPKKTGLKLIRCTDPVTGYEVETVEYNPDFPFTSSVLAYGGAKKSRENLGLEELLIEIKQMKKGNASKSIGNIKNKYGHASVAGMADLDVSLSKVPDSTITRIFGATSLVDGQQTSTRFVDFSGGNIVSLSEYLFHLNDYNMILNTPEYAKINNSLIKFQQKSLELFRKWRDILTPAYNQFYQIEKEFPYDIEKEFTPAKKQSALMARVLDTCRAFLTFGLYNKSSMHISTHARECAAIISSLKSSKDPKEQLLGQQIHTLLCPGQDVLDVVDYTPEASHLVKYADEDETTDSSLDQLELWIQENITDPVICHQDGELLELSTRINQYGPEVRNIALLILSIRPEWEYEWICSFVGHLDEESQIELSHILFDGYDCYDQVPDKWTTDGFGWEIDASLSEYRDLNRHRAWSRFSPLVMSDWGSRPYYENFGFILPLYLEEIDEFSSLEDQFIGDLIELEAQRVEFLQEAYKHEWFPDFLARETILFATNAKFVMSAGIKQISYMTDRRERPGGHINYRRVAWMMADQISKENPLLSGLKLQRKGEEISNPDPSSRMDFLDRS